MYNFWHWTQEDPDELTRRAEDPERTPEDAEEGAAGDEPEAVSNAF